MTGDVISARVDRVLSRVDARGMGSPPFRPRSATSRSWRRPPSHERAAVMVFPRDCNGSHNPDEGEDPADLVEGVRGLHRADGAS